ncbi:MAG: cytochrome C [Phycisphaerae bacterium]|nr:cytochrome C [Phycisphaerae bacterium]NUQ45237.1 cytochrome C [Phycisphaerae bacterium]
MKDVPHFALRKNSSSGEPRARPVGTAPAIAARRAVLAFCCSLFGLAAAPRAAAQQVDPKKRPTGPMPSCTVSGCHAEVTQAAVQHGPVAANSCDACHRLTDEKQHKFDYIREKAEMCYFCHDQYQGRLMHDPVAKGDCLECHNPHGGKTRQFLRADTIALSCGACHADVTGGRKFVHGPVAAGGCVACHNPHVSDQKGLLLRAANALCLECHVSTQQQLGTAVSTHEPVRTDCLRCHTPHASDERMQLNAEPEALCMSCHEDIRSTVQFAKTAHGAVVTGRKCLNCHEPHATPHPRILRNNPKDICLDCHNQPLDTPTGRIADMKAVLAGGKSLHGPIAENNCAACHEIHGGSNFRLLTKEYPPEFYAPFREEAYALCFSCHEKDIVHDPKTTTLTGFRNGDLNLHFLHVNKDTKGRTCRACHETHASNQEKHIRDSVPFGKWEMPIGFRKTETGGSCAPGCHTAYAYDREKPVVYPAGPSKATWPADRPGTAPPPNTGARP